MKSFNKLSPRGQKIRIVKDAITQIKTGVVTPTGGNYFFLTDYPEEEKNLQTILKKGEKDTCEACAKGSLFAACVLNTNKVYLETHHYDYESFQKRKLSAWFGSLELDMIEAAFERDVIEDSKRKLKVNDEDDNIIPTDLGIRCIRFGNRYKSSKNRLLAILNNILENGEFKP